MKLDTDNQRRKNLRLPEYDYCTSGYYFVTVCTHNKESLFGEILNGNMNLNEAGEMIEDAWYAISEHYSGWEVDSLVVMPNHVHSIVVCTNPGPARGPAPTNIHGGSVTTNIHGGSVPTNIHGESVPTNIRGGSVTTNIHGGSVPTNIHGESVPTNIHGESVPTNIRGGSGPTISLPELIRNLKSYTMNYYRHGVLEQNWPMFKQRLWQRNYYEHIIRSETSLHKIREYILKNPAQWEFDQNNPVNFI